MLTELRRGLATTIALVAAAALTGCLDPVDPGEASVAEVRVTFDGTDTADTIQVRGTTRANAMAIARQGYDLGRTDFAFSSSNESVAFVEPTGVVRAIAPGTAIIRAVLPGGKGGEGRVVVVPSSVEYTIPVGNAPGAMAFSPDYARLYVTIAPDSLAIVDALGYVRLSAIGLGLPGGGVAATGATVYVTHPASDSVSVISTATNAVTRRVSLGGSPNGAAATPEQAFIAIGDEQRIAIMEGVDLAGSIPVGGTPHEVAVARDGRRVFATVEHGGGWRLVIASPATRDTVQSLALGSAPAAIATDLSGTRVYVLLPGENRVVVFTESADGRYAQTGSIAAGAGAGGVSSRLVGSPLVVVSGQPLTVFDGSTLALSEQIPDVGTGRVAVRPDGVFAFISGSGGSVLRVIGL